MTPTTLILASLGAAACGAGSPPGPASALGATPLHVAPPSLEELYRSGLTFQEFLARADRRKAAWHEHYEQGSVSPEMIERAGAIPGRWRILAIAEDWCSDSVNTIPFLALLAERVERLEMRIVDSDAGREIMEANRTADGRAATPTLVILDEAFENAGCWIERPAELQTWALERRSKLEEGEFLRQKMAWYREDGGKQTVKEIVTVIEAAASGHRICGDR